MSCCGGFDLTEEDDELDVMLREKYGKQLGKEPYSKEVDEAIKALELSSCPGRKVFGEKDCACAGCRR